MADERKKSSEMLEEISEFRKHTGRFPTRREFRDLWGVDSYGSINDIYSQIREREKDSQTRKGMLRGKNVGERWYDSGGYRGGSGSEFGPFGEAPEGTEKRVHDFERTEWTLGEGPARYLHGDKNKDRADKAKEAILELRSKRKAKAVKRLDMPKPRSKKNKEKK